MLSSEKRGSATTGSVAQGSTPCLGNGLSCFTVDTDANVNALDGADHQWYIDSLYWPEWEEGREAVIRRAKTLKLSAFTHSHFTCIKCQEEAA